MPRAVWIESGEGGRYRIADERMVALPCRPYGAGPCAGSVLIVVQIVGAHQMQHGQLARTAVTRENRKIGPRPEHSTENVGCAAWPDLQLKHRTQACEVHEHRLAVTSVTPVARMLSHVCVNGDAVSWRMSEPQRLLCLHLSKGLPAPGGARHVLMDRSSHIGNKRSAPRATDGRDRHTPQSTSSSVMPTSSSSPARFQCPPASAARRGMRCCGAVALNEHGPDADRIPGHQCPDPAPDRRPARRGGARNSAARRRAGPAAGRPDPRRVRVRARVLL